VSPSVVVDDLQDATASKRWVAAEWLRVRVFAAHLGDVKRIADDILNILWKLLEVVQAAADPDKLLESLAWHYGSFTILCQWVADRGLQWLAEAGSATRSV
jgi:hypothetical protein